MPAAVLSGRPGRQPHQGVARPLRFVQGELHAGRGCAPRSRPYRKGWIAHYAGLGAAYPLRSILASGTHGDISPGSGGQAREFAEGIIRYNARAGDQPRLVNATFPMFWQEVDAAEAKQPFLPVIRGCFGHSWDLWPVSLAKYAAAMREGERRFLSAETLLAIAGGAQPGRPSGCVPSGSGPSGAGPCCPTMPGTAPTNRTNA